MLQSSMIILVACALGLAVLRAADALDNGAALTPPMGWSTWNKLHCNINATVLLAEADAMVGSGMVAAGYKSLNIDDCWPLRSRSASGEIVPDPAKFPNGMKDFSDELAKRGISLGIYTAHGPLTCQRFPGSLGHEKQDAATYQSWNVTFVKNDWCWRDNGVTVEQHLSAFEAMRDALGALDRPIVHSIHWNYENVHGPGCDDGVSCPIPSVANMWRIGGDISPKWGSITRLIDTDTNLTAAAKPGAWNDADMLEVGNGMTDDQDRAHFTMWCILSSPLIAGNDLTSMSEVTRSILTNKHAIAVNQDALGDQARLVSANGTSTQAWVKRLTSPAGAVAVALLNRDPTPAKVALEFSAFGGRAAYTAFDIWAEKSIGNVRGSISANLAGTSASFYTLTPAE